MRLGLMGGTFDPIHNGHLRVARAALARGLDRLDFVPARRPPHKTRDDMTDPFHRFAMAALATLGEDRLGVSACEVAREGPSYTIDTVRQFVAPGTELFLIMGSDSLAEIDTWRECRVLLDLVRVLVYARRPYALLPPGPFVRRLPEWVRPRWESGSISVLDGPPDETSSTAIRAHLRAGRPASDFLPPAVAEYVTKHHLYAVGSERSEATTE